MGLVYDDTVWKPVINNGHNNTTLPDSLYPPYDNIKYMKEFYKIDFVLL